MVLFKHEIWYIPIINIKVLLLIRYLVCHLFWILRIRSMAPLSLYLESGSFSISSLLPRNHELQLELLLRLEETQVGLYNFLFFDETWHNFKEIKIFFEVCFTSIHLTWYIFLDDFHQISNFPMDIPWTNLLSNTNLFDFQQ